jgi:hypothetical protein
MTCCALRAAHPDDSLEALAARLDCSLSTVKRHLRRARREASAPGSVDVAVGGDASGDAGAGRTGDSLSGPTVDEVFDAFEAVVEQA